MPEVSQKKVKRSPFTCFPSPERKLRQRLLLSLRLTISFILKRDALWAKAGHEVAWEQFCIQEGALLSSKLENRGRLKVRADEEHLSESVGDGFSIRWEKK